MKNAASSALSVLQQPCLPQQLQTKDFPFRPVNIIEERERRVEVNVQDDIEDPTRPSKRPRISTPEPAHQYNAGMVEKLYWTLHRALGFHEVADFRNLSQIAQLKLLVPSSPRLPLY